MAELELSTYGNLREYYYILVTECSFHSTLLEVLNQGYNLTSMLSNSLSECHPWRRDWPANWNAFTADLVNRVIWHKYTNKNTVNLLRKIGTFLPSWRQPSIARCQAMSGVPHLLHSLPAPHRATGGLIWTAIDTTADCEIFPYQRRWDRADTSHWRWWKLGTSRRLSNGLLIPRKKKGQIRYSSEPKSCHIAWCA